MINLYKRAIEGLEATWPERYRDICSQVMAVHDWANPAEATDELVSRIVYDTDNGISSVGQAFVTWPKPRPSVCCYRNLLQRLKDGLHAKYPSDKVAECRSEFKKITRKRGADSIFNRIVSAFLPGQVSPVMFESDFDDACAKLVQGGYINPVRARIGDDPWHSKNVQLMTQLRESLPEGAVDGARWPITDYTRGIFVWGVHHDVNMDDWMILRNHCKKL